MIPSRKDKNKNTKIKRTDNYRRLALYIADASHKGEKLLCAWHEGSFCDDYYEAIAEAVCVQDLNTRTTKDKTYHLVIGFRPEDESRLNEEAFKDIANHFGKALGFEEHNRHCGVHINTANMHMHIAFNMIHPEKFTRHEPYRDFFALSAAAREMEQKYGLYVDNGKEAPTQEASRPNVKAQMLEAITAQETLDGYVKARKDTILQTVLNARDWGDVHIALATYGLTIAPRGNGLIIQTKDGQHQVKASTLDRTFGKSQLEKRFGPYMKITAVDRRGIKEKESYSGKPVHRYSPERNKLYRDYQDNIKERIVRLEALDAELAPQLEAVKRTANERRMQVISTAMLPCHRQESLKRIALDEKDVVAQLKAEDRQKKKTIRSTYPPNWAAYLQKEAENGNVAALQVLRSRETKQNRNAMPEQSLVDWREREEAYVVELERKENIKAEYRDKARKVYDTQRGVMNLHRRGALNALKMEEFEAVSQLKGLKNRHVDAWGNIVVKLSSGGTIKDSGREVFFSDNGGDTQTVAMQYASFKWGPNLAMAKGRICFQEQPQPQRKPERSRDNEIER